MTDDDNVTRRRVLEATGATAVLGIATTGTASASHVQPGACYRTTAKVGTYERACPNESPGPFYPEGTQGLVWQTCVTSDGQEMADFVPYDSTLSRAWAPTRWLERC